MTVERATKAQPSCLLAVEPMKPRRRAGIDTGGTFTDAIVAAEEGSGGVGGWQVHKRPTTPKQPAKAVLAALQALIPPPAAVDLVHGTTHATNALLTGRLGRTVFVTTAGFADLLAIGRQDREALYALEPRPPRPPQPRRRIVEVHERLDADGAVVTALSQAEIRRVVAQVRALKPQGIAVGLLHAFRNGDHEQRLGQALQALAVPVRLSSEVAPEYREYERFCTAWADAALAPVVGPALESLERELQTTWGSSARLQIMRSDGGSCGARAAADGAVHLALSGPAGGLAAARSLADARGDGPVLSLDMGGTSTDVALLTEGELPLEPMEVGGLPLLARGLPLHTVGTGGGSLASWDAAGALRVGPGSAGAEPGPACYGKGGRQATVTDAHLLAGRLHPQAFLGGEFPLHPQAAAQALADLAASAASPVATENLALGILEVATAGMERALRRVSLAEGWDPRQLKLYAFGGAGGLHAAWLAERMGMPEVVIPPFPGAFSAMGLLAAPLRRTLVRSVLQPLPATRQRKGLFDPLVKQAVQELREEGLSRRQIKIRRVLELRGEGQAGQCSLAEGPKALERFHQWHQKRFGFQRREQAVQLVSVRVQADGPAENAWTARRKRRRPAEAFDHRPALLVESGGRRRVPWYQREAMRPGHFLSGPAVVAEYSGTTVVPAGWVLEVDAFGACCLRRESS